MTMSDVRSDARSDNEPHFSNHDKPRSFSTSSILDFDCHDFPKLPIHDVSYLPNPCYGKTRRLNKPIAENSFSSHKHEIVTGDVGKGHLQDKGKGILGMMGKDFMNDAIMIGHGKKGEHVRTGSGESRIDAQVVAKAVGGGTDDGADSSVERTGT